MIEHPKVFRASRMGCLNTAANCVFTARSCEMDYTYDPPQHDYEHARWPCVPEECEFSVIGVVNQRFRPVPQETFTINSGEINGVFHRHICDYDSMSGVFVWPNRDPLGEPGFETLHLVTQPLFIRKLRLNINDSEMQYFLAMAIQSGGINIADYLRNSHASYTGNTISTLEFLNFLVSGQATYAPNWPVELLEYPNLFGFVGNDPIDDLDPNGLWNPFKAIWNWLNKPQRPPSNAPTSCSVGPWTGNDPWGSYGPKIYGVQVTIYIKGQ